MELKKRIFAKLDEMHLYLEDLEQFLPSNVENYQEDRQVRRACEKTIELAIETVISIISIIVSHQKFGLPKSEDDLITIVENKKVISRPLATIIREMKGFRNLLVHRYAEIDDLQAYHTLSEDLRDFATFEKEIRTHLKTLK